MEEVEDKRIRQAEAAVLWDRGKGADSSAAQRVETGTAAQGTEHMEASIPAAAAKDHTHTWTY